MTVNPIFQAANKEDIKGLITVQNKAFYSDYIKYGCCPGYNRTFESMEESIDKSFVFKIMVEGQIVGDIIVREEGKGAFHLGCLCVVPEFTNKGIGQNAIRFIEKHFEQARHWSLDTPADKEQNVYFYKKCGYHITREYECDEVKLVLFEKDI